MKVGDFQRHIADLYLERDRRRGLDGTLLWLIEEVGEATEAARRREAHLADELADVIAWTVSVANLHGIDLEAALARKYPATCKRCGAKPCACPEPIAKAL
ncbi:MAG TPA: MazG nucleotide pyrophosphohydrolase domain-containing protein [Candidatus Thermoplasmatota archaeon]|nr:MazG nucleotide pyrophosphohydrolase domain-containing protein [Candidatus Thermoplasmatota archaeon]